MILIDLTQPVQNIVFYAESLNLDGVFQFEIKSDSTNQTHSFSLENNLSKDSYRAYIYQLNTALFDTVQTGIYNYSITYSTENLLATQGKLRVKNDLNKDVMITPESEPTQYIVFNG
ncbi:hypothetical protein [Pedobacter aquatilis]|uniref:hypothetical protein n=1 Tax=Pedobacter aquatilis TaxID=351343 RepID=UPI002930E7A6|nr:hypothetical protein [Pedobacter aquatilis]